MADIMDGRALAKVLNQRTKKRVAQLAAEGIQPGIAMILVGDDPASEIYTRMKDRLAKKLGIRSFLKKFPSGIDQETVIKAVEECNHDDAIDAILVQEPLPEQLDSITITNAIDPAKDVDGFHPFNLGRLYSDQPGDYPIACTPRGIMTMLDHYHVDLEGKRVVVVGRSILVGKPMFALLNNANATTTLTNRHTTNLFELTKAADLLIVAAGHPGLIKATDVKPGAVVVDVGTNRLASGKLVGDVDFDSVKEIASLITPVPGGVGPMTTATLMQQTVDLVEWKRHGKE